MGAAGLRRGPKRLHEVLLDPRDVEAARDDQGLMRAAAVGGIETIEDVVDVTPRVDLRGRQVIEQRSPVRRPGARGVSRRDDGNAEEPALKERGLLDVE